MINKYLLVSIVTLLIISCKKEDTQAPVQNEKQQDSIEIVEWQRKPLPIYLSKNIVKAQKISSGYAFISQFYIQILNDSFENVARSRANYTNGSIFYPPFINNDVVIFAEKSPTNKLHLFSLSTPFQYSNLDVSTIDTVLKNIAFSRVAVPVCVNNNGKMLVAATEEERQSTGNPRSGFIHFLLFQLELSNNVWVPKFEKQEIYIVDTAERFRTQSSEVMAINTINNDFYVSLRGGNFETLKVTEDGNISQAFPLDYAHFITIKDTTHILGLYGLDFGWGYSALGSKYNVLHLGKYISDYMRYAEVDGKVIGYIGDRVYLYALDWLSGRLFVSELENKGLPDRTFINSILVTGDEVLLATTEGAFTKKLNHFFEFKQ